MSLSLSAREVRHSHGGVLALDDVSLDVNAGSITALVGESGSGKTTLLKTFNRMIDPDAGSVWVGDVDVRDTDPVALRRRIGYVPQHGGLLPHWTVHRNVALVPRLAGANEAGDAADAALLLVGLDPARFASRYPHELSGGQRQRAALARSLAGKQQVILLDEPFGALDAISRAESHEAFERVRLARAFTGILVTHDLSEAARLADRVVVLRGGRVEQAGTMADLRQRPATDYVENLLARAVAAHASLVGAR